MLCGRAALFCEISDTPTEQMNKWRSITYACVPGVIVLTAYMFSSIEHPHPEEKIVCRLLRCAAATLRCANPILRSVLTNAASLAPAAQAYSHLRLRSKAREPAEPCSAVSLNNIWHCLLTRLSCLRALQGWPWGGDLALFGKHTWGRCLSSLFCFDSRLTFAERAPEAPHGKAHH